MCMLGQNVQYIVQCKIPYTTYVRNNGMKFGRKEGRGKREATLPVATQTHPPCLGTSVETDGAIPYR